MKDKPKNKDTKDYETILTTWNKGTFGKYKLLKKIIKEILKNPLNNHIYNSFPVKTWVSYNKKLFIYIFIIFIIF